MQFTKGLREGIRRGRIKCSVRVWTRPHVKVGGRYPMEDGHVVVDSITPITFSDITYDLARESGFASIEELLAIARHGKGENVYLIRFHYLFPGGWDTTRSDPHDSQQRGDRRLRRVLPGPGRRPDRHLLSRRPRLRVRKGRMAMVWVAFLRGINVGGNNMVSMKSLKEHFEQLGFGDVRTYINSGNVLFRSAGADARALERKIDTMLLKEYGLPGKTVVRSYTEMGRLVKTIAKTWGGDTAWRYNVVFLRHSIDSRRVLDGLTPKPDIEHVVYCPGTLLWSARTSDLTRTAMLKLASQPIYKDMTVRNINTTTKIFALMQEMENHRPPQPARKKTSQE